MYRVQLDGSDDDGALGRGSGCSGDGRGRCCLGSSLHGDMVVWRRGYVADKKEMRIYKKEMKKNQEVKLL